MWNKNKTNGSGVKSQITSCIKNSVYLDQLKSGKRFVC